MPKVRRNDLPRALYQHLLSRVYEREITTAQLEEFFEWLETEPEVPEGSWFKRFRQFTVCGRGELIKTFLRTEQTAIGEEL
jgi:hypothetical protein